MSNHFSMGAINKETFKFEYPKIASKENRYKCPCCENDVIFKKGKIKQPHYAHKKSNNPCHYYNKPNESQIHKTAKLYMKTLLENQTDMTFYRKCCNCYKYSQTVLQVTQKTYNEDTNAIAEYTFQYNNSKRSADVALVENNVIKAIFEICYKHKTKEENRPEPWVEIDAEIFINNINSKENNGNIEIECKREYKCAFCEEKENIERQSYCNMMERMRIKSEEQRNERRELFNMGKEDERQIQLQREQTALDREKKRLEMLERENTRKKLELEKEKERKKVEEENNEKKKEEKEYLKTLFEQDETCSICKINYCKCNTPNFIVDHQKRTICTNCIKRRCKCVKITSFFKK